MYFFFSNEQIVISFALYFANKQHEGSIKAKFVGKSILSN